MLVFVARQMNSIYVREMGANDSRVETGPRNSLETLGSTVYAGSAGIHGVATDDQGNEGKKGERGSSGRGFAVLNPNNINREPPGYREAARNRDSVNQNPGVTPVKLSAP